MSDAARHAAFLVRRLQAMGLRVSWEPGSPSALGELPLRPRRFPTLGAPVVFERAAFYTLGHNRLKLFQPRPFFDLPAIDVSRCETKEQIEEGLRRAWAENHKGLREGQAWLEALGARVRPAAHGTRLYWLAEDSVGARVQVRSRTGLELPSSGALGETSLGTPNERRFRPLASLDSAGELERAACAAVRERAARAAARPARSAPEALVLKREELPAGRALAIGGDPALLAAVQTELELRGIECDCTRDANRALAAFRAHSYDIAMIQTRLPRCDGFELTHRIRLLPGVEALPIVLVDDRDSAGNREAAQQAGATAYLPRPERGAGLGDLLADIAEHGSKRRFKRYSARLGVRTQASGGLWDELTECIGRGGITLRTRRDVLPGALERYRIALPRPLEGFEADGEVVSRVTLPGYASVLAGIRFVRFSDEGEARWIRVIEELEKRRG